VDSLHEDSFCNIPQDGMLVGLIRMTKLIIWDEAAMQHRNAAESVDRSCRDVRNKYNTPFGGITVVLVAIFYRLFR
jgi:hypothetical protein